MLVGLAVVACGEAEGSKAPAQEPAPLSDSAGAPDEPVVMAGRKSRVEAGANGAGDAGEAAGGVVTDGGAQATSGGSAGEDALGMAGIVVSAGGAAGDGGAPPLVIGGSAGGGGYVGGTGGTVTSGGSAGGSPVKPWRVCEGGKVCELGSVCVYDSDTHRMCTPAPDFLGRCDPYAPVPPDVAAYCGAQEEACSVAYERCNWLSKDAAGTRCPNISQPDNRRWNCGPPSLIERALNVEAR